MLNDYLGWVLREHDRARLHGLQSLQGTGAISRPLSDVYISLAARRRPAVVPGELPRRYRWTMGRGPDEMAEPQPADMAELLTLGDRVAIVGGAGCGKTTYLSFVAASLASALAGRPLDARLKPRRPGEPLPIPLVAPLRFWRAYRDACADRRERILDHPDTGTLAGFLLWYLRYRYKNFEAAGDFFDRLLKGRGCLVMLDGLDDELLWAITTLNRERAERKQEPLTANPLLVTMVVSVKYSRRELPRERAKLYDGCVDVVLES